MINMKLNVTMLLHANILQKINKVRIKKNCYEKLLDKSRSISNVLLKLP